MAPAIRNEGRCPIGSHLVNASWSYAEKICYLAHTHCLSSRFQNFDNSHFDPSHKTRVEPINQANRLPYAGRTIRLGTKAVQYFLNWHSYGIIHVQITGVISPTDLVKISRVLVVMYLAAICAIIKVPMLTSHIFSGTSAGSSATIA